MIEKNTNNLENKKIAVKKADVNHNVKNMKVFFLYAAFSIIILYILFSSFSVNAETATERKKRLEKEIASQKAKRQTIQSELTRSLKSIVELENQIAEKENEISKLQKESKETREEVDKIKEELAKLEEECKKKEEIAKKRLTYMYEFGEYKTWEILLKSDGILDFFSNYYMLKEIAKIDNEILKDASRDKKRVETLKTELESKKKVIDETEERVKKSKVVQENLKVLKQDNVKKLNNQEKQTLSKLADLKRQHAAAEAQIAREMERYNASSISLGHPDGKYIWPLPMSSNYMTTNYGDRPCSRILLDIKSKRTFGNRYCR